VTVAAFTLKSQGVLKTLDTAVGLSPSTFAKREGTIPPPESGALRAIWDTGASGSVVSMGVALKMGLQPVSHIPVATANGKFSAPVFICDIYLPSGVVVPTVEITGGKLGDDLDMLIGMDVITLGDFTITNLGGDTWFTFRIPSMQRADYKAISKPNEEHRCPCGSTKKYK
jgi:hypothetical protein